MTGKRLASVRELRQRKMRRSALDDDDFEDMDDDKAMTTELEGRSKAE